MIKNRLIAATLAAAALAVPTGTAGADGPERFTDQITVEQLNPCTGEVGDVEITFEVARRVNENNTVLTIKTSSVGEDGWTGRGSDTLVISERGLIEAVNLRIVSPDGGRFFVVKHVYKFGADGTPQLVRDTIECRR
jgi:hypothetical protein